MLWILDFYFLFRFLDSAGFAGDWILQPILIFVSCFRGRKYHKARSEKRQREYYENLVAQNNMRPIAAPPPLEDIASNIQEEYAVVASPPLVALPDPTAENDVQVEQIRALKRKLRHAVTVANGCARVLEDERAENSEQIRKLSWALRLERDAHTRRRRIIRSATRYCLRTRRFKSAWLSKRRERRNLSTRGRP